MPRIAYVNGRYLPHRQAMVHIEDRGYQLADGVYEVCAIRDDQPVDEDLHFRRLERSMAELRITPPMERAALKVVIREVARRNRVRDGLIYLQITRGVAPRDQAFPKKPVRPALTVTARMIPPETDQALAETGVTAVSVPDIRWGRCDIKSISLLPNVLARQAARDAGAHEAVMVDGDGCITEGAATNLWIVDKDGNLITRQADHAILNGITRQVMMVAAGKIGAKVIQRPISLEEAYEAREVLISGSVSTILPVISLDGRPIGNGAPGTLAVALRAAYGDASRAAASDGKAISS